MGVAGAHGKTGTGHCTGLSVSRAAHGASANHGFRHLAGYRFNAGQRLRRAQSHFKHAHTTLDQRARELNGMGHIGQNNDRDHRPVLHHLKRR